MSFVNCRVTGWEHRRGSRSSMLFLCTSVCTEQHRRISPVSWWARVPVYMAHFEACIDTFDLLPHCYWMSVVCPPSVIGPSLLLPVLGTVCPNLSRLHPPCLFSEVVSRLSSSGVPSHDFYDNFYIACAVTAVIFGHINRSFYLLTYSWCSWLNTNSSTTHSHTIYRCCVCANSEHLHFTSYSSNMPITWLILNHNHSIGNSYTVC